ncbi:MAG: capsule biosynthesis protein [Rhodobacterales bacterium]|nr:MAG: capsule biosynthesis protein [Rhodobacterales bacterium]
MTTKPKAKKYRIRRGSSLRVGAKKDTPQAVVGSDVSTPTEVAAEQSIDEIRKEGLTGRQLRMARRVAQKYNLPATSDFDAVRLLRAKGIDPFQRATNLELVPQTQGQGSPAVQLPQTVPAAQANLPSTEVNTEAQRAYEIQKIQRDIAKRRRRKLNLLLTRLSFFVLLPTLIVGYYYYKIATPMYATHSEFIIQKADAQTSASIGSLFGGTGLATSQDSIAVQSYLQSRDAMLRLDQEHGFKLHFTQDNIDPIQRLDADSSSEDAYKIYQRNVLISYDPTDGIIQMEVIAADPQVSATYSRALISYAEEQVDSLTTRLRNDQMKGAIASYEEAEKELKLAQERVVELQEQSNIISGDIEITMLTTEISAMQAELNKSELLLEELKSNTRPNPAKVAQQERKIKALRDKIADRRDKLTESTPDGKSIARINSELAMALANQETRGLMLQAALQQKETANIEASRQTRYLSLGVSPIPPDTPTYPRKFENTILAFLIFSGIYLMMSLTASVLREQVTS